MFVIENKQTKPIRTISCKKGYIHYFTSNMYTYEKKNYKIYDVLLKQSEI